MVALTDWDGLVSGRTDSYNTLRLVAILAPGGQSWASPFRGIADDDHDYFIKTLEGCRRDWARGSLAVEYVVGQAGRLIDAPVCENTLIRIPEEFADYEIAPGIALSPGIAHASKAIEHAEEQRDNLAYRSQDRNSARHAGVYALYDWCYGDDPQWLYDRDQDRSIYSHDHGLYLPPHHGTLDVEILKQCADEPNPLPDAADGLDPEAIASKQPAGAQSVMAAGPASI
ncbi:HipA family kinase [Sphaerimonospora cavernae]|uniref:HipA family kinase n=1 Tax=Sphaerimonospora cavernae TaxID=1740611 RepID=A0ABV6UDJ6_9ACTN